ncbi:polyhydroxyalkanoic acid system family protein [Methylobacterium organophilum]|uniref:polyhydroxyalkanoic acid system family protein n=1 Tax=Methylobacterium organophilum TaxID=410 RepID=UPI001F139C73|nr:polyhydroxyalkanoic acid system family protein [Methylobacterium organophilum]UMY15964.1 polyhydroxyalkanoic acid system family protein [Methylobacterium organophilum]
MAKPLVVEIPHELGRAEARRRIEGGMEKARAFLTKSGITIKTLEWVGDRLDYSVSTLGQSVDGSVDVQDDRVRLEARLPMLLALFAEKVQDFVGKEGTKLLTKK